MNATKKKCSVFITGATGFVGSALIKRLLQEHVQITAAVLDRDVSRHLPSDVKRVIVPQLSETCDYSTVLQDVDIVMHLAARVHVMKETAVESLLEYRKVNLYGTECLARQAVQAGVKRFVFMSTIGVNGNISGYKPFVESDEPVPHNPYSISKLEAEIALSEISKISDMEVVVVRAPLVYGPGNPGNFLTLLNTIAKGIPLPLASVSNQKSFLYVENLSDALSCCLFHPKAAGQTYLLCDCEDISTPELIRRLALALGRPVRLIPFPIGIMRLAAKILGKSPAVERLLGSLQVDSSKIKRELGWKPPFTLDEGLAETARWFQNHF